MTETPPITLRYFDCRGRVQPLRYYLRCRNIPFIDARISMKDGFAAWQAIKDDQHLTGPFRKLPVLHWGQLQVAETAVIHEWLHHKIDAALLSEQENLQHAMLSSSCRSELTMPLGLLIYQDAMYPAVDLATTIAVTLKRITDHLKTLERVLKEWAWFEKLQQRPMMLADCLLWEELDKVQRLFAEHLDWSPVPALHAFVQNCQGAAVFRRMLAEHPCQITGRPGEAEALARIHAALKVAT